MKTQTNSERLADTSSFPFLRRTVLVWHSHCEAAILNLPLPTGYGTAWSTSSELKAMFRPIVGHGFLAHTQKRSSPWPGFEPRVTRLRAQRSTTELFRNPSSTPMTPWVRRHSIYTHSVCHRHTVHHIPWVFVHRLGIGRECFSVVE